MFFFSSRRRHTRSYGDWSSDVCSSDLVPPDLFGKLDEESLHRSGLRGHVERIRPPSPCQRGPSASALRYTSRYRRSEERRVGKESKSEGWKYASSDIDNTRRFGVDHFC